LENASNNVIKPERFDPGRLEGLRHYMMLMWQPHAIQGKKQDRHVRRWFLWILRTQKCRMYLHTGPCFVRAIDKKLVKSNVPRNFTYGVNIKGNVLSC